MAFLARHRWCMLICWVLFCSLNTHWATVKLWHIYGFQDLAMALVVAHQAADPPWSAVGLHFHHLLPSRFWINLREEAACPQGTAAKKQGFLWRLWILLFCYMLFSRIQLFTICWCLVQNHSKNSEQCGWEGQAFLLLVSGDVILTSMSCKPPCSNQEGHPLKRPRDRLIWWLPLYSVVFWWSSALMEEPTQQIYVEVWIIVIQGEVKRHDNTI